MSMFDDPNREAVGLEPIWTGAVEVDPGDDDAGDGEVPDEAESETPVEESSSS